MIDYLVVYLLGLATPILFKVYVLPKLKQLIKDKVKRW